LEFYKKVRITRKENLHTFEIYYFMRIWSLHPKYLDAIGLVALWREALLARKVLEGKTIGYKNHPQLERFRKSENPLAAINIYLSEVYKESLCREYNFNINKIISYQEKICILLTKGQLHYETIHLLNKVKKRDLKKYNELKKIDYFDPHPLFKVYEGDIETWEKHY